jgi:ligand-binding sensor domain-containing protein
MLAQPALDLPPVERRVVSTTVGDVLARYPAADALQAQALFSDARRYRYTSATIDPMNRIAFFGTDGRGVLRFDARVERLEPLPFGLLSSGVGALEPEDGGVWIGTSPDVHGGYRYRTGFTWITEDFQQTRHERGPGVNGFGFGHARDLMTWEGQRWAATDIGLVRLEGGSVQLLDRSVGFPSNETYVLAATSDGLWVGTGRGVVLVQDGGEAVEWIRGVGAGAAINAMVEQGDSLWVGGPAGLLLLPAGTGEVIVPANEWVQPFLQEPVIALATSGSRVVMAMAERIIWRNLAGEWKLERPLGEVGLLTALSGDSSGVWIGGHAGVQFFRFETGDYVAVAGPGDLPGPVRALAVTETFVWIGTDGGLVRIRKDAILP